MSEYWKSTERYWCKHCSVFVRDTKLERANHESTGKHQGAIKRALRDLHRSADQKEREKERAKREVERLNGVVSGSSSSTSAAQRTGAKPSGGAYGAPPQQATQADRQKQLEQLADLGVNIPTELRGDMAMAGEWTVTTTRVIEEPDEKAAKDEASSGSRATGIKREREKTEEEKEQEEAINGLFKKRRQWGVDSKTMPADEDVELEALLSGPLVKTKKEESEPPQSKTEDGQEGDQEGAGQDDGSELVKPEPSPAIKKEPDEDAMPVLSAEKQGEPGLPSSIQGADNSASAEGSASAASAPSAPGPAVMFKKRKPKNIRQK